MTEQQDNKVQQIFDTHGALIGLVGIALALVFGVLWLTAKGDELNETAPTATITAAEAPATLPNISSQTTVGGAPSTTVVGGDSSEPIPTNGALVGVKIDNAPRAVPQIGLGLAEIIIEVPVEGGLTRFTAFFVAGSNLPLIGPVRSLRWTDADLLPLFTDAIVTSGGRDFIEGAVAAEGVDIYNFDSGLLVHTGAAAPHDVGAFVSSVPVGSPKTAFARGTEVDNGDRPDVILIPYSGVEQVEWRWEGGAFARYSNGAAHQVLSEEDGDLSTLTRDSVLVLSATQSFAGYTDTAGADVPVFDLLGTGRALLATPDGMITGTWIRLSAGDVFTIVDEEGAAVSVPLDNLGIAIVPTFVEVTTN